MTADCGCGCGGSGAHGTCGCCEGVHPATPQSTANPAGLPALACRVGTHGSFLATMLSRLSAPELAPLAARTADDPAIALLDAWATVGDVLTFYQERIANEGYLRTATELESLVATARLVGYEPRPGTAASTYLAYTLDRDLKGADTVTTIPQGSRAQSVPEQDQLPQSFETDQDLVASSAYNDLKPLRWRALQFSRAAAPALAALYLAGTVTDIKPGDEVLLVFGDADGDQVPLKVAAVRPEQILPDPPGAPLERTVLELQQASADPFDAVRTALALALSKNSGLRDLSAAGLAGSDAAAAADADALEPLENVASTAVDLAAALAVALARLGDWLVVAQAVGARTLANWLAMAITTLAPLRAQLGVVAATRPSTAEAGLQALLTSLARTPVPQPASALELTRSPAALLGRGSDLGPRLLAAFAPGNGDVLYRALAAADFAAPSALVTAQALRVKATPFGATAPLRPVLDARGVLAGAEEWPLQDPTTVGVRWLVELSPPQLGLVAVPAGPPELVLTADVPGAARSMAEIATATSETDIQLRPGKADVTVEGDVLSVKFRDGLPATKVRLERKGGQIEVRLSDDANRIWRPGVGEVLTTRVDGQRISVSLAAIPGDHRHVVTVFDERLAEPDPATIIALDARYDQIVPGSWVVIEWGDGSRDPLVRRVLEVATVARTAYGQSATVTQLRLSDVWLRNDDLLLSAVRSVLVHAQSLPLTLAPAPVEDDVAGSEIDLSTVYDGLETGRWIIVEGERTDLAGVDGLVGAEVAMIAGVTQSLATDPPYTTLLLARPLAATYRRPTVNVWGNVVRATHGESHEEVLGSGDAKLPWASYPLQQASLTYLASSNALGAESTLEVRVDGVRWHGADDVALLEPDDRRYVTRTDSDGRTTVLFGDGRRGARPPTGIENLRATYRTGVGRGGNLKPRQISQLQTRPLGVSAVVNPLASTGGADRDTLTQVRQNAPVGLRALERLVSVADYEDFTRARAGIGKASARELSDGRRTVVHVTIAGAGDIPIDPTSDLFGRLRQAYARWGDPAQPVQVAVRELVLLVLSVGVQIDPDWRWVYLEPQVRARLLEDFGFNRRELGQPVYLSEVQSSIQSVRGVVAVDVDVLTGVPATLTAAQLAALTATLAPPPATRVPARLARFERQLHEVVAGDTLTSIAAANGIPVAELVRRNPRLGLASLPLQVGGRLIVFEGMRAAELALLSPDIPDTLILREVTP